VVESASSNAEIQKIEIQKSMRADGRGLRADNTA